MGMIGNSLAQGLISGANIQDGTVDTPDLKDGSVTTAKQADASVTTAKVADANITAAKLASTAVTDKLGFTPAKAQNQYNPAGGINNDFGNFLGSLDGYGTAVPNSPDASSYNVPLIQAGTGVRGLQIAAPYSNNNLYWRNSTDSGWRAWKRVANNGEDASFNTLTNSAAANLSSGNYSSSGATVTIGDGQYGMSAAGGVTYQWASTRHSFNKSGIFSDNATGPIFLIQRASVDSTNGTVGYSTVAAGSYLNLADYGYSGYNAFWHYGLIQWSNGSGEGGTWNKFRLIARVMKDTGDNASMNMKVAGYFYANGWSVLGSSFGYSNMDSARGYNYIISPWINLSSMPGYGDVAGLGLYADSGNAGSLRVGSVYIQYAA